MYYYSGTSQSSSLIRVIHFFIPLYHNIRIYRPEHQKIYRATENKMNESELVTAVKEQDEKKAVAIAATKHLPPLKGDEVRIWAGLAPMVSCADKMPDTESLMASTMFTVIACNTAVESLCDCEPIAIKYSEVLSLYNKSRYANISAPTALTPQVQSVLDYVSLDSVERFLGMD